MADAGRVIAGSAKGVRLAAPGPGTRPLTDRVKQALFAVLEPELGGAAVLDLFAGSGAGGIEALSRGAARAVFVERDRKAAAVIEENLGRAGFGRPEAEVLRASVQSVLDAYDRGLIGAAFGLVLLDPPYDDPAVLADTLSRLGRETAPLAEDALVVAKHFWRDTPSATVGLLASERVKRFGETSLTFYRRRSPDGPGLDPGDEEASEA